MMQRTAKCPQCGASLEITPDAIIFVCLYCGWAGSPEGLEAKGYLMVSPAVRGQLEAKTTDFLKSKLHEGSAEASVTDAHYIAIPFWRVGVWAHTTYNGYQTHTKTETYYVGKQMQTRSYTVYVPVHDEWTDQIEYKTVARKNAAFFGLDEITARLEERKTEPLDPEALISQKMQVLDIEVSGEEANESGRNYAEDQHRRKAQSETAKLYDCYTDTRLAGTSLTLYPVYSVNYQYQGRTYRITVDGSTGDVVKAELPLTRGLRMTYASISYIALVVLSMISLYLSLYSGLQRASMLLVIGSILAAIPLYYATASQRVKRSRH